MLPFFRKAWDLLTALRGVGLLALCQAWESAGWFAIIAAQLGYAYALARRMSDALPHAEAVVHTQELTRYASQGPYGGHDVLTDEREGAQHLLVVAGDVAHHDLLKT